MHIGPWQELTLAKALSRETVLPLPRSGVLPKLSQRSSASSQRGTNSTQTSEALIRSFNLHTYHRQWQKLETLLTKEQRPRKPPVPRQPRPIDVHTQRVVRLRHVYGFKKAVQSNNHLQKVQRPLEPLVEGCEDAAGLLQWVNELPDDLSACSKED